MFYSTPNFFIIAIVCLIFGFGFYANDYDSFGTKLIIFGGIVLVISFLPQLIGGKFEEKIGEIEDSAFVENIALAALIIFFIALFYVMITSGSCSCSSDYYDEPIYSPRYGV